MGKLSVSRLYQLELLESLTAQSKLASDRSGLQTRAIGLTRCGDGVTVSEKIGRIGSTACGFANLTHTRPDRVGMLDSLGR